MLSVLSNVMSCVGVDVVLLKILCSVVLYVVLMLSVVCIMVGR